jgi:hypothetical protein
LACRGLEFEGRKLGLATLGEGLKDCALLVTFCDLSSWLKWVVLLLAAMGETKL